MLMLANVIGCSGWGSYWVSNNRERKHDRIKKVDNGPTIIGRENR